MNAPHPLSRQAKQLERDMIAAIEAWAPTASHESVQQFAATAAQALKHFPAAHDALVDLFGALDDAEPVVPEVLPGTTPELDAFTQRRSA